MIDDEKFFVVFVTTQIKKGVEEDTWHAEERNVPP